MNIDELNLKLMNMETEPTSQIQVYQDYIPKL